jgi:hypothetical protein
MSQSSKAAVLKTIDREISLNRSAWQVRRVASAQAPRTLVQRLLRREEPSTFQRCLAVHLHFSSPRGGLS